MNYDLIVIGAGPGGYVAAIHAAKSGLNVLVVEKQHLGGVCLNYGCIPTKALIKSASMYDNAKNIGKFGLSCTVDEPDMVKIVEKSRNVATQLSSGVKHLLKKNKVTVVEGFASFKSENEIVVDGKTSYKAKNFIIATGARARNIPSFETDSKLIWNAKDAMLAQKLPKKLLIVGSGAIGIEFAYFYHTLGSKVTILEAQNKILPNEDDEISKEAEKIFTKKGIEIHKSIALKKFIKQKDSVDVEYEINQKLHKENFDKVIMAVGIVGNTENLNLEQLGIQVERGQIITNEYLETTKKKTFLQ